MTGIEEKDLLWLVNKELESANKQFPLFHSEHEGYAVILEEVEEVKEQVENVDKVMNMMWQHIKLNCLEPRSSVITSKLKKAALDLATEALQVAAMAQKMKVSMYLNNCEGGFIDSCKKCKHLNISSNNLCKIKGCKIFDYKDECDKFESRCKNE